MTSFWQKALSKKFLTMVIAVAAAAPLYASAKDCGHGVSEVRLEVTSSDVLYDPLNGGIGAFLTQVADRKINGPEVYVAAVTKAEQLRQIILGLKSECRRIKELSILSHGDPGYVAFPENPLEASNLVSIFFGLRDAFTDNPKIKISGCNIAKGCLGRAFLLSLAKILIKDRGILIGSTQFELSWFRLAPFIPVNLFRQALIFDSTQQKYKFDTEVVPCTAEMEAKITKLTEFLQKPLSPLEKQSILEAISYIRESGRELQSISEDIFSKSRSEIETFLTTAYSSEEKFQILIEQYGSDRDKMANKFRLFNK